MKRSIAAAPEPMKRSMATAAGLLAGSVVAMVVAVGPPLHEASEELFAWHMVQHLVLVNVAAPLLAAGLADPALFAALPWAWRRSARGWVRSAHRLPGEAVAIGAWLSHVVVLWAWHAPALYEAALRLPAIHALEHVTLFATATLFWAMVLGARGLVPLGSAAALLYLFAAAGQSTALGALLALTAVSSYTIHAETAARWGLTALEDQQLAGLIMWALGSIGYLAAALRTLAAGLRDAGRHPRAAPAPAPQASSTPPS